MLFRRLGSPISRAIVPSIANIRSLQATHETLKRLERALHRSRFLASPRAAGALARASVLSGCGAGMIAKPPSTSTTDTVQQMFQFGTTGYSLQTTVRVRVACRGIQPM